MLSVVSKAGHDRNGRSLWLCRCSCGNEKVVLGKLLRKGSARSCGCSTKRKSFWPKYEYAMMFNSYRSRAKAKKMAFTLGREQFLQLLSSPCRYCGSRIDVGVGRRNSKEGYTMENSVSACRICNYGKNTGTEEDFLAYIDRIRKLGIPTSKDSDMSPTN